ncbi:RNA ligase family protein [Microcoleus vaginatus]|uniref:RNA ligase family protein n=1 Tax=Microcoleus vaginatus TaxID=119532 RepID=UPI00020D1764|nr:DNA ligase-like protein [Microcoleus vaginatus FGP-2]
MLKIVKYPRTYHIEGSRFQPGDEDLDSVPFSALNDRPTVIEEKVDGANTGICFAPDGQMLLQSRGHYLTGGPREKHFNLFKQWAFSLSGALGEVLGNRYILYGEWLYAKHTVFYDFLPHYFMEYDVLDLETNHFLSTESRRKLLNGLPLVSVPVVFSGVLKSPKQMMQFMEKSNFIQPGHLERLRLYCGELGLDEERCLKETDKSEIMEGLYIKVEEYGIVKARYKYVRASFLTAIKNAEGHWLNRPIIPNILRPGTDLFKFN